MHTCIHNTHVAGKRSPAADVMVVLCGQPISACLCDHTGSCTALLPLLAENPAVLPVESNVSLLENSSLHLAVFSSGDPIENVQYLWRRNGVIIDIANISAVSREATLPSVQFQGDVQYSCTAFLYINSFTYRDSAYFNVTVYGECRPEEYCQGYTHT